MNTKTKQILLITLPILLLIAALAVTGLLLLQASPQKQLADGLSRTANAVSSIPAVRMLRQSADGGSVELESALAPITERIELPYLGKLSLDGRVSLRLYCNRTRQSAAALLSAQVGSVKLPAATLYASADAFAVSSDMLLPQGALGFSRKDLSARLSQSAFAPDSGSGYALPESLYDALLELDAQASGQSGELERVWEKGMRALSESLLQNAALEAEKQSCTLDELPDTPVRCVTLTLSPEQLNAVYTDLLRWMREDADFRGAVLDRLPAAQREAFDTLPDSAAEQIGDRALDARFYLHTRSKQLVALRLSLRGETSPEYASIYAVLGPDAAHPDTLLLESDLSGSVSTLRVDVSAWDNEGFDGTLTLSLPDRSEQSAHLVWTRADSAFTLTLAQDGQSAFVYTGDAVFEDTGLTLTLRSGNGREELLALTLRTRDSMPDMPDFTDVSAMQPDELDDALKDAEEAISDLAQSLLWSLLF